MHGGLPFTWKTSRFTVCETGKQRALFIQPKLSKICPLEFFIVFELKNNKQFQQANARATDTRLLQINPPLETTVNDTEISRKSFQKFRKLLNFGKRTIQPKILKIPGARFNGKKTSGKKFPKFWYTSRSCSLL